MEKQSQNPMAVEPIPRLMARIGTPIVLSMILQAAYNVVDSAYLARMADGGEAALTALSLAFPVQLFMVAVSIGTGVGTNALLARLLGQGDREQANRTVGNAQFIALCITVVFMLFAAVGVRPNVALVQEAGGQVGKGIVTDDTGLTTLPDVYAAGDCCESADLSTGEHRVLALLPNAYLQGECAGKNMAGSPARFDQAVAMNAMGLFGLHLITAGSYRGEALVQEDGGDYKAFFVEDGLLKGYILVGDCLENAGVYTALIRERTPLSAVDFGLLRQHPRFAAFSRERRREMFG